MNLLRNTGISLQPVHFSKELVLEFKLGPQVILIVLVKLWCLSNLNSMSRNELLKPNYHFCTVRKTVKCAPTLLIIHPSLQNIFSSTHWSLWWKGCVQLRRGRSSSTRETRRANWWPGRAGWQIQVTAQPSSLLEKSKIKSPNCHTNFGKKRPESLVMW